MPLLLIDSGCTGFVLQYPHKPDQDFVHGQPQIFSAVRDSTGKIGCRILDTRMGCFLQKAEVYLQQARNGLQYAGGRSFDYISVCPPYEKASYEELYSLLDDSPLVSDETVIVVEYARKVSDVIRDTIGPLTKVRDKRYGRTFVAVYASHE